MKALVIYNPSAGMQTARAALEHALGVWRTRGWEVSARETAQPGEATRFAREAAQAAFDVVIAVGGDGTMNEVANGLFGSQTALGVLPFGTANVWAKEMGLPFHDFETAARLLADAEIRAVDVGQVRLFRVERPARIKPANPRAELSAPNVRFGDPRIFLLWCGVGLDAWIVRVVEPQREIKRRLGALFFWLVGIKEAWNYRGKRALVEVDGVPLPRQIILALASNVQLYGGVVRIATEARLDDGVLDLVLLKGAGWWQTAWHLIKVFFGWHRRDPEAEIYRAQTIVIRAARVPVHVDGELIGVTPVEICLLPRALRVLVPPTANRNLFGRAA